MATKKETTPKKTVAKKAATPKTPSKRSASVKESIHDKIAKKAYELYEQSGRIDGKDVEHWLQAEKMVNGSKKKK